LSLLLFGVGRGGRSWRRRWEEGKVGVGGRVRSLVLERLRMNAEAGVVGRWQEVRKLLSIAIQLYTPTALTNGQEHSI
jgi:hypothetical protein